jgi:two-component system sensor histidine kinase ResE
MTPPRRATRARTLGLQGWLVGAFLLVGIAASLAVLLVLLPTLESNVRQDRAKLESERLAATIRSVLAGQSLVEPLSPEELRLVAQDLNDATNADIRITYRPGVALLRSETTVQVPGGDEATERLDEAARQARGYSDDGRLAAPYVRGTIQPRNGELLVRGAQELSGVSPELAIVRQRVIVAMAVVLALASLAGVLLARLIGGRLRRLANTAATLSGGDLSVRSPELGVVPEELVILQRSLDGMAERLQSFVTSITDERDRDRAMIGSLAEGVLAVGADDTVTVANDAASRMLGLPEGAERARLETLPPAVMDAVRAARAPGAPAVAERQVVLAGGAELELHVAGMRGRDGAATVVTLRDVTGQRRLERARRDLVANVSHELKTPIAALKGFLELLENERVAPDDRRDFLAAMTLETARLERLVEEQLQLARLDAGALPLDLEDVDLAQLVEAVVEARAPLAEREGITLDASAPRPGPLVLADVARIEQVLLILLDNAVRHTPPGGSVRVSVSTAGGDATMTVRDTGEGIAPGDLPFIFDRFYRGDPSREGRSAGLGLAIARGLVAAHRGAVTVDSALGEGTTFTVTLPLASAGAVTREEPIPPGLAAPSPGA